MVIKFTCPEGHPLSCPDDRAGKAGKCPKCGTKFLVPEASENGSAAAGESDALRHDVVTGEPVDVAGSSPNAAASKSGGKIPKGSIVFLCPNGHKLNGPADLAGKKGQCPHCGARFQIPSAEDLAAAEEEEAEEFPEEEVPVGTMVDDQEEDVDADLYPPDDPHMLRDDYDKVASGSLEPPPPPLGVNGGGNSLPQIFARLWRSKGQDAIVEVYLDDEDRAMLSPERFAPQLSTETHAVFAIEDEQGMFTVTAIPWTTVKRVEFRKVGALPPEFKE